MEKKNIEAIYPLTMMQQALLFHGLHRGAADRGFLQARCTLVGPLEMDTWTAAWQQTLRRHPVLRTSVHWEELEQPLQVVHKTLDLAIDYHDWRGVAPGARQERLDAFLAADQARGLDLSTAPVMRLTLLQTDDQRHHFVWSCHHLLLDGWSSAIVLKEVLTTYDALARGHQPALARVRPYRDYVLWLRSQDAAQAERYWRTALAGFTEPTPLPGPPGSSGIAPAAAVAESALSEDPTAALQAFARRHRMTLSTLLQGAWALLLRHHSGRDDIVFGATVSGRPPTLPGVDQMVGLFINAVPVRAHIDPDAHVRAWLEAFQQAQQAATAYHHAALAQVQSWSDVPGNRGLFDSLMVVENYPWDAHDTDGDARLAVRDFGSGVTTVYPLTLLVRPGPALTFQLRYDAARYDAHMAELLLVQLCTLLTGLVQQPEQPLATVLAALGTPPPSAARPASLQTLEPHRGDGAETGTPYVAPREALEVRLVRLWEDLLGQHPIGVHDDFFALGGTSMVAVELFNRIARDLGTSLPLVALLEAPTVEGLARLLRDDQWAPRWDTLVAIQPSGHRPPLFCVHAGAGDVLFYRTLAEHLGADQPVYALRARGVDGRQPPLTRIADMAAAYLAEIRTVQPEGPYHLLGYCFGSKVAFEMAQQLHAAGQAVPFLGVLDSEPPRADAPPPPAEAAPEQAGSAPQRYLQRALHHLRRGRLLTVLSSFLKARVASTISEADRHRQQVQLANREAARSYVPGVYPGRITLLRSDDLHRSKVRDWHVPGWQALTEQALHYVVVPGTHRTVLQDPHVGTLAEHLRGWIAAPQTQPEAAPARLTDHQAMP